MWNFQEDFNFYPAILKRKQNDGPVVSYSYKQYFARIDRSGKKWIIRHNFSNHIQYKTFPSYHESRDFLFSLMHKNRVKILF